jgi:peroxiredoxin
LVQLQKDLKSINDAGIQVIGISYDSPAVLKRFSERSKVTFPLLSDPESKTIDAYHIRNKVAKGKAVGVPHPGTFILDQEGVIRAKLFLEGYRDRHSTEELIKAAKTVK